MRIYRRLANIENGEIHASIKHVARNYDVHQHEYFEMEYILSGSGHCQIDGISYAMEPGSLFFLTPANFHSLQTQGCELINLSFSAAIDYSDALFRLTSALSSPCFRLTGENQQFVYLLAKNIVTSADSGCFSDAYLFLNCILRKLASMTHTSKEPVHSHVSHAVMYILENFTESITLAETAEQIGLSKEYLSELFTQHMGVGFKAYLDNLRFEYAKKLLTFSSDSIFDVCGKSGFSNYANFSRRFKERYQMTPSQYRRTI